VLADAPDGKPDVLLLAKSTDGPVHITVEPLVADRTWPTH